MTLAGARLSLNGADWQLKGFVGEDWPSRNAHRPALRDRSGWRPGRVPGTVHDDLWRARRVTLHCEGVDYSARFYLNGEGLGQHAGTFVPAAFDVTEVVRCGQENLLAVVVDRAPAEQPQVGYTSRIRLFKPRMNYWWDFCPRMIHVGVWDDVYLQATGPVRLDDVWVRPRLNASLDNAEVTVTTTLMSSSATQARVATALCFDGARLANDSRYADVKPGANEASVTFALEEPRLLWPNSLGQQPLYLAEVSVAEANGEPCDVREAMFGIRDLRFVPNKRAASEARPCTLVANGRRTYIRGWNWVPIDVLYGVERPAKRERLLRLAQRAHVNLLRVWGGGLIEKEAFCAECDRRGLLVWQEFTQSSSGVDNQPAAEADFISRLGSYARQVIRRRRNHPSLALWCGGNELQAGPEQPPDERHPALAELRAAVDELGPDRLRLPTSPSGPRFGNSLDNIAHDPLSLHDVHGPWEHQGLEAQYTLYNRTTWAPGGSRRSAGARCWDRWWMCQRWCADCNSCRRRGCATALRPTAGGNSKTAARCPGNSTSRIRCPPAPRRSTTTPGRSPPITQSAAPSRRCWSRRASRARRGLTPAGSRPNYSPAAHWIRRWKAWISRPIYSTRTRSGMVDFRTS